MTSFVWGRDPQEAFEEPYEYRGQEQLVREAEAVLPKLYRLLNTELQSYTLDDVSADKAVWLLAMDTLDSLRDCLSALVRKNHRVAGKLFRDVRETMDLAAYFRSGDPKSQTSLKRWYADKVVSHSEYRNYVQRTRSETEAKDLAKHYSRLSRFTHRTYTAILDGYVRGRESRLAHDNSGELFSTDSQQILVLPQTIASYYAVLSNLILEFADVLPGLGLATADQVGDAFADSFEAETVPRHFMPRRLLAERLRESRKPGPEDDASRS
jgi:hypothetical protein